MRLRSIPAFLSAAAVCLLCGCGHAPNAPAKAARLVEAQAPRARQIPPQGRSREPTPPEQKLILELMSQAEQIRELEFLDPVPVVVQDRAAITAYIESEIEDEELERATILYTALGMLESDVDIKSMLLRVLGEQILGYFDPKERHLVVRDDIMQSLQAERGSGSRMMGDEARIALIHELVHALQSQHLGLSENIDVKRDTDADNAYRALIEGDASLAMIAFLLREEHPDVPLSALTGNSLWVSSLSAMAEQLPMSEVELGNAPEIVRGPLLFAYIDGVAFASRIHGQGGWKAVNQSYVRPPLSTKQVLHPERFLKGEQPVSIRFPDLPSLHKAGYRVAQEDTLGELETGIYFIPALDQSAAKVVAEGWNGDRVRVYQGAAGDFPVVWFTLWDDEQKAELAEASASRVARSGPASAYAQRLVARQGKAVLILRQLPLELQDEAVEVFKAWVRAPIFETKHPGLGGSLLSRESVQYACGEGRSMIAPLSDFRARFLGRVFHEYRGRGGQALNLRP